MSGLEWGGGAGEGCVARGRGSGIGIGLVGIETQKRKNMADCQRGAREALVEFLIPRR